MSLFIIAERVARRICGAAAATDVASETMVRVVIAWSKVYDHPEPWVARVAINLAVDSSRREHRTPRIWFRPAGSVSFEAMTVDRVAVAEELARLPRRQREVIVLRYMLGMPDGEIAERLQLSIHTVRTHSSRALAALRGALSDIASKET